MRSVSPSLIVCLCALALLVQTSYGQTSLDVASSAPAATAAVTGGRIQCDYKDDDGESLILNCTLISTQQQQAQQQQQQQQQQPSMSSAAASSIALTESHGAGLRIGMERAWRTPWESLAINTNIVRTLVWRHARLALLGPFSFRDLNFVQRVDLAHNRLRELSADAFRHFELDVLDLDVSGNELTRVPSALLGAKRVRSALETLRLSDNPIAIVERHSLEPVRSSLKVLEMSRCGVRYIEPGAFDDMRSLESLRLDGNLLRSLDEAAFAHLTLRAFHVHDNPLVCDCHMRWLVAFLKSVDYQRQIYETQMVAAAASSASASSQKGPKTSAFLATKQTASSGSEPQQPRCDQPNSLRAARSQFVDINPDSFMCDVQVALRLDEIDMTSGGGGDGGEARLVCHVYGDPEPNVYWSFGQKPVDKALSNEADKYETSESRSPATTNKTSELRIRNLNRADLGVYTCTAEIVGSNNRKHASLHLTRLSGAFGAVGVRDAFADSNGGAGESGVVFAAVGDWMAAGLHWFVGVSAALLGRALQLSNWTLALVLAVLASLLVFMCALVLFLCCKCRCCGGSAHGRRRRRRQGGLAKCSSASSTGSSGSSSSSSASSSAKIGFNDKEKEQLMHTSFVCASDNGKYHQHKMDQLDHYNQLSNESSATLLSSSNTAQSQQQQQQLQHNTIRHTGSIRMAYSSTHHHHQQPHQHHHNHQQQSDLYANHSLLTTTSNATGSYNMDNNHHHHHNQVAIDASQHTPRYQLLQQQQHQQLSDAGAYYDDLRPLSHEPCGVEQMAVASSPLVSLRRDDPTVPLYATLKPKLLMQQQQQHHHQQQQQLHHSMQRAQHVAQYVQSTFPYMTMMNNNRSSSATSQSAETPPLPLPRKPQQQQQQLPPPPPPPIQLPLPPLKPKRTFEYSIGAGGCGENNVNNYDNDDSISITNPVTKQPPQHHHKHQHQHRAALARDSATSLDEEDLDLNDLKDFEDVTFDNLRKPGDEPDDTRGPTRLDAASIASSSLYPNRQHQPPAITSVKLKLSVEQEKQLISQRQKHAYHQQQQQQQQQHRANGHLLALGAASGHANSSEQSLLISKSSSADSKSTSASDTTVNMNNTGSTNTATTTASSSSASSASSAQQSPHLAAPPPPQDKLYEETDI